MQAVRLCHQKVVQLLIGAGADVNIRNEKGQTALGYAKKCLKISQKKANIEEPFDLDAFLMHTSGGNGNPMEIIQMLENVGAIE